MHRIRVGVLRGGQGDEYENSLQTGAMVLNNLPQDIYNPREFFIDREGQWHVNGLQVQPHDALEHVEVVFNALHGSYGEDGRIQHILESHGIPFTGAKSFSSVLGMNRIHMKNMFDSFKLKTPRSKIVTKLDEIKTKLKEIFMSFPLPLVVKPAVRNSSDELILVKSFDSLEKAVSEILASDNDAIVEEYINGLGVDCIVIDNFRNKEHYTLPIVASVDFEMKNRIEEMAVLAHKAIDMRHYSSSNFVVHPRRGIYLIETRSLPNLHPESLFVQSLDNVGASMPHFLDHVVQLALSRK